ncbi:carbonic anhydrase family protein [Salmonella enterica subsp. enterica serovar Senftenberg]|nr:carbonic anhydrase family protein [Salmonella enterica subsp. enterica serovar Senftenberg]
MRLDKQLLSADKRYWRFNGWQPSSSCLVNAVWVVLQHPLTLSSAQLENLSVPFMNTKARLCAPFRLAMKKSHAQRK